MPCFYGEALTTNTCYHKTTAYINKLPSPDKLNPKSHSDVEFCINKQNGSTLKEKCKVKPLKFFASLQNMTLHSIMRTSRNRQVSLVFLADLMLYAMKNLLLEGYHLLN